MTAALAFGFTTLLAAAMFMIPMQASATATSCTPTSGPAHINLVCGYVQGTGLHVDKVTGRFEPTPPDHMVCGVRFRIRGTLITGRHYDNTVAAQCGLVPYASITFNSDFKAGSDLCVNAFWGNRWWDQYACTNIHR